MTAPSPSPAPPPAAGNDAWHNHVTMIAAIRDEVADVRTYDLVFRDPAAATDYVFAPGQFNMLYLPGIGEAAVSISSDPRDRGRVCHTVKAVGNVTQALARLREGDEVVVRGPFGTPWPLEGLRGQDVVIATGGVGLASVRAAILHVVHNRGDYGRVAMLFGAKTPQGLLYARDYDDWRRAGIDLRLTVDEGGGSWTGNVGLLPALLDGLDLEAAHTSLLCCGPEPMMLAVAKRARVAGVAAANIHLSMERNMSCAARLCGLCQFGPEFVCRDGPVLAYDRLARFLDVVHL